MKKITNIKKLILLLLVSYLFFIVDLDVKANTVSDNQAFDKCNDINNVNLNDVNYLDINEKIIQNRENLAKITVAIIDSGVDITHVDLEKNIIAGYNFIDNSSEMYDDAGHGTLLAGIIGGEKTGLAKGVKIMPIKVLNKDGFGKTEDLVKGIIWAVDNGADIINLSIGRERYLKSENNEYDTFNEMEYKAIEYALLNNVTVVFPCGNFNTSELCYPAAYEFKNNEAKPIIVSGYENKEKFFWSNTSPLIDVCAPANNILSTIPKILDENITDYYNVDYDGYSFCGGTSEACAYVTAFAAILKSFNNELSNEQIRNIIISSAKDLGDTGRDKEFGYGLIDLKKGLLQNRLDVEIKDNYYQGDKSNIQITVTDYKNERIKEPKVYQDSNNTIDIIEGSEQIVQDVENAEFDNTVNYEIYQYYKEQDKYILKGTDELSLKEGKVTTELAFDTPGLFKIKVFSPKNMAIENTKYYNIKPLKPTAKLKSGLYIGKQELHIESTCSVYYTYGNDPLLSYGELSTSAKLYHNKINIDGNRRINIISFQNGIASDIVTLNYTILQVYIIPIFIMTLTIILIIIFKIKNKRISKKFSK